MGEKESKDEHQLDAVLRNNTEFVDVGQKYARKKRSQTSKGEGLPGLEEGCCKAQAGRGGEF